MDFEPCFEVYNLVSIRPKSMKLGQMINLNVIVHMVGSVYRLVTIRNSPQFPVEFRNGLFCSITVNLVPLIINSFFVVNFFSCKWCYDMSSKTL